MPILNTDPILNNILTSGVRCVAKKAPTLGGILSPSMITSVNPINKTWLHNKGNYRCGHARCICCRHMHITKTFKSIITGQTFNVNQYINCNTTFVVYLISCRECGVQYVGSTKCSLKTRIRRHLSDVNCGFHRQMSAVSSHCANTHARSTSSLLVQGIERVDRPARGGDYVRKLRSRETYWMFVLQTCAPTGLNKRSDIDLYY